MEATTGMVPKEVPIPMVIRRPTASIRIAPLSLVLMTAVVAMTRASTEWVSRSTLA